VTERPTKEQVDFALEFERDKATGVVAEILAAEVRALRAEVAMFRDAGHAAELRIVELRAELDEARGATLYHICLQLKGKLARVELILPKLEAQLGDFGLLTRSELEAKRHTLGEVIKLIELALRPQ
jgi:hypothetical protein